MRVPDEIRDCVCFIETRRTNGPTELGSAFFVGADLGFEGRGFSYVVTAKHCVVGDADRNAMHGVPSSVVLRLNSPNAGIVEIETEISEWLLHSIADVAVLPIFSINKTLVRYVVWGINGSATEQVVRDRNIGPGDDVFVTGLLVHHPGVTRIMPVVRLGCISALPQDSVTLATGDDVVALVETRSIGGISGSPVFVHLPFWRDTEKGDMFVGGGGKASSGGENWLLGVMHGFYPVGENDPDGVSGGNENLNTGIAVVVRVDRVLDLINRPDQVEMRSMAKKQLEDSRMPNLPSRSIRSIRT